MRQSFIHRVINPLGKLYVFLFLTNVCSAQHKLPSVDYQPQSPTAAAFTRYGEIPVDHSTGVPNINIPIYELSVGEVKVPVSFSYHSSGIKVRDVASEAGLGFVVNAGGVITAEIIGLPDASDAWVNDYRSAADIDTAIYNYYATEHPDVPGTLVDRYWTILTGGGYDYIRDHYADRFHYSLCTGEKGVFRKDFSNGNIRLLPYQPVKIDLDDSQGALAKIEIVSANGYKHTFNRFNTSTDYFVLDKVITADNTDTLQYYYTTSGYYQLNVTYDVEWQDELVYLDDFGCGTYSPCLKRKPWSVIDPGANAGNTQFTSAVVDSIVSKTTVVLFTYNTDRVDDVGGIFYPYRLVKIVVKDRYTRETVRSYDLHQSYFGNATDKNRRLKLDSITVSGSTVQKQQTYVCTYNTSLILPAYPHINGPYIDPWSAAATDIIVPRTVDIKAPNDILVSRLQYHAYNERANPLTVSKENDVKVSYLWGHHKTYPVAKVLNADNKEIFFDGLEEGTGWDANLSAYDKLNTHTGRYAGRINKPDAGEKTCHSTKWLNISLTQPVRFKYSGWYYSDGPSVEIFLFMKTATETGYFTQVDAIAGTTTGKWVYIEKEFTVSANITQLNIRVDNNGGGTIWFDDVRLHPARAQMTTYTYTPLIGVTSESDMNSRPAYYEYDGFGRLAVVRDQDRNVLKKFCYNYYGQQDNCQVFTSGDKSRYYYSQNCSNGETPEPVWIDVPAGKYTSTVSQLDADAQAEAFGQQEANSRNTCRPPDISIVVYNNTNQLYTIELYNKANGAQHIFYAENSNGDVLATVPAGTYDIYITSDETTYRTYTAGCNNSMTGNGNATFSDISLTQACNTINLNY